MLWRSPLCARLGATGDLSTTKIVTLAPELPGAEEAIAGLAAAGVVPSMGHSMATLSEAQAGQHRGAKLITHLFNAMVWHTAHTAPATQYPHTHACTHRRRSITVTRVCWACLAPTTAPTFP